MMHTIPHRHTAANLILRTTFQPNNRNPKPSLTTQIRQTSTTPPNTHNTTSLLAQQRLRRPLSPHLTIYRPQITSVLSVLMRNTGLLMSGAFCLFPLLHLTFDISTASLAASFGSLSLFVKVPLKTALAWIFTFHAFNSLRVVAWGFAKGITNKRVWLSGWGVVGVSFVSALALATCV